MTGHGSATHAGDPVSRIPRQYRRADADDDARRQRDTLDDLADLGRLYPMARSLLLPGREQWSERTIGDEERDAEARHARLDREARAENARRGISTLAAGAAPPALPVLEAVAEAERLVIDAAVALRIALDLGPLAVPGDLPGAEARFLAARAWLVAAGVPGASREGLRDASRRLSTARLRLLRVVFPEPLSVKLRVPCPSCERMSLRAHVAPRREDSYVRCHASACGARWPWSSWGTFGELTGVDVWTAVQQEAA